MNVQYLNIDARERQMAGLLASLADFTVSAGAAADARIVLSDPNLSLYCFDDANQRAIFVELPDGVDLAAVPFIYQTQYEQAQRLLAVPYDTFRQIAHSLPEIQNLILVYISGRSGSTLLHHVFNELDSVVSFSEPDVLTQFVHLRRADGSQDAELRDLLDGTVRMLFKSTTAKTYALKFRSEALQVMDLYQATFPQAKNLFLYRDAVGFVSSFYRIFRRGGEPEATPTSAFLAFFSDLLHADFTPLAAYLDPNSDQVSPMQQLAVWWLAIMEWYLKQAARGIPILAVRYADLNAMRGQVLSAIFAYCGLPTEQAAATLDAFARDSQAGTHLARDNPSEGNTLRLTDAQIDEITQLLARHPVISVSDFIAPGTLRL